MGTGKILQGILGLTNPFNAIYNKLTTGEFVPGIDVGAAVDQLVTGTDRDIFEGYSAVGGDRNPAPGKVLGETYTPTAPNIEFPDKGDVVGQGTSIDQQYQAALAAQQQAAAQAAAQQAAEDLRAKNYNREYLTDQDRMLLEQLGRLDTAQTAGLGKIGTQYEMQKGLSEQDRERQLAQYGDSRTAQGMGREKAFGEANKSANNAFRSLSQIIGRGAGTASSAFRDLLPNALNQGLNQNRGSAIENYATNMQGIKKSEDQYGLDFAQVLQDLLDQRMQNENSLKSGIEGSRQGVNAQRGTIAGQLVQNENPYADYASIKAAQSPYKTAISQSANEMAKFDAYTPEFKRSQVVAATPNINEYTTDRSAINAQSQGVDPSNVYASLLRKRLAEQG